MLQQASRTILLLNAIHRFGDAVGIKQQWSAGIERDGVLRVRGWSQAKRQAGIQFQKRTMMIDEQWTRMSGTDQGKLARAGVEHSVDHGDEFSRREIFRERPVEMLEGLGGRCIERRK